MSKENNHPPDKRQYPPFYEIIVPIAIGILAFAILILLVVSIIVVLGIFPGNG